MRARTERSRWACHLFLLASTNQQDRQPRNILSRPVLNCVPPQVRLPFSKEGLKVALLNAERYAERNVQRHLTANKVAVPDRWRKEIEAMPRPPASEGGPIDFDSLVRQVEQMSAEEFSKADIDSLVKQHSR